MVGLCRNIRPQNKSIGPRLYTFPDQLKHLVKLLAVVINQFFTRVKPSYILESCVRDYDLTAGRCILFRFQRIGQSGSYCEELCSAEHSTNIQQSAVAISDSNLKY